MSSSYEVPVPVNGQVARDRMRKIWGLVEQSGIYLSPQEELSATQQALTLCGQDSLGDYNIGLQHVLPENVLERLTPMARGITAAQVEVSLA